MRNVKELWEEQKTKKGRIIKKNIINQRLLFFVVVVVGNDCHFWHLNSHTWDKLKQKHVNRKSYVSISLFLSMCDSLEVSKNFQYTKTVEFKFNFQKIFKCFLRFKKISNFWEKVLMFYEKIFFWHLRINMMFLEFSWFI